ncbi:hypothetical protein PVAND_009236 [Polypedilum vanderplanki]|uniref:G-protein coupled receptors family 2 profile 2 domain-containing protein n=1 Tax=Polypedilum vanderplanki TaxID=319348 RepID=A0A9J6CD50_POLVA|nr:hypothetical protein PVAND_009236 [Polypedilum vanderplanki]
MKFLVFLFCLNSIYCQNISCDFKNTIDISGGKFDNDKNYIYKNDVYKLGDYAEFKYKIVNFTEKILVDPHIRGCVCKFKTCIRMCCQKNDNCLKPSEITFPQDKGIETTINLAKNKKYEILLEKPCKDMYKLEPEDDEEDAWAILTNGSLQTRDKIHNTDSYCLLQLDNSKNVDAYLCFEEEDEISRFIYYPVGMILSIPFLILTLTVYAAIADLRNIHGKCLMCYICGLIVLYFCLIHIQTSSALLEEDSCISSGYVLYISLLFCFVWLNIMCYDIWFVSKNGLTRVFKNFEHQGFILYAIYGFASPVFIGTIVYLIDTYELLPTKFLPRIGHKRCWLQENRIVEAIYVYIPMSILIIINIILFLMTARIIWKAQKITKNGDGDNLVKENVLRSRFYIYLRLFIIMGMSWFMETLSWIFHNSSTVFIVTDIFNCLQGVFIFIICVLNFSTRQLIARRCCPIDYSEEEEEENTSDEANRQLKQKTPAIAET